MNTYINYHPGNLVGLPQKYHGYSRILQLHAPNPYASRFENIPNTNYGNYCFKPFIVVSAEQNFVYCAPVTSRKAKHEASNMHGDIIPVENHYHIWAESIAVNNMIPIPREYLLPVTKDTLPAFRSYRNGDNPEHDWNLLPTEESVDLLALTTRALQLRREVENQTIWALKRCPNFPACERFSTLISQNPELFMDPPTRKFIRYINKPETGYQYTPSMLHL